MLATPVVEVHITNIHARDPMYHRSITSSVAHTVIAGAGVYGYELAIRAADRLAPRVDSGSSTDRRRKRGTRTQEL